MDTMTDKSVEIVEGLVVRAPANGRRTHSEAAKRSLVEVSLRPGVSGNRPVMAALREGIGSAGSKHRCKGRC